MLINLSQPGKALCFSQYVKCLWHTGRMCFTSTRRQEGGRDQSDGAAAWSIAEAMAENARKHPQKVSGGDAPDYKKLRVQRKD